MPVYCTKGSSYFYLVNCFIKERSFIAKLAAWKLGATSVAIVVGRTIHLHNTKREQFLANPSWVKHELAHIRQYREHGFMVFIIKYIWESIMNGYENNRFEIAARAAEHDTGVCEGINFIS